MTVNSQISSISYVLDGVTLVYPVPFYVLAESHLAIGVVDPTTGDTTPLNLGSDYTVQDVGVETGCQITLAVAGTDGNQLQINRSVPIDQQSKYEPNDKFPASTTEDALDKLTMIAQQHDETISRAVRVPVSDLNPSMVLPPAQQRANKALGFDDSGNPFAIDLTIGSVISPVVNSINLLRLVPKLLTTAVFVLGYYGGGDGGGGSYYLDVTDHVSLDNGGTIIVAADGGRWKLAFSGSLDVRQFGAKGDGVADDTQAIQRANDALSAAVGGNLYFSAAPAGVAGGRFVLNGVVVNTPQVTWHGTGSPNGGLLVQQPIYIKQSGFSARLLDCQQGGTFVDDGTNSCFIAYSTTLTLSDFVFEHCTFNGFFYSVDFLGVLDSVPNGDAQHLQNPIYNTRILFCKSTAPVGQNAGHFQHQSVYGCLVMGCETYNGQNASSYNFTRDCRDIKVIGNYDASSAWGACEIENSPLANAVVTANTFESTAATQFAAIWVDDSANVRVFGNVTKWLLKASCGNSVSDPNGPYPAEVCTQTQVHFSNNSCPHIQLGLFSIYVSGSIRVDIKDNEIFGDATQAILADQYYVGGEIDGNKATGTITFLAQIVRTAALRVFVRGNNSNGAPCNITGSGGTIIAHDNDSTWSDQTETNLQGMNLTQGVIKMPSVEQGGIAAGASANFVFTTQAVVPQFSITAFDFRCLCRVGAVPADDYVKFSVLVTNESGSLACSVSALNKQLTNAASNFTVAAAMVGEVMTITVTNTNASNPLTVRMFAENLMRL